MKNSVNNSTTLEVEQKLNGSFQVMASTVQTHQFTNKQIDIFLVDDDSMFLKALEVSISNNIPGATICSFQTGESCLQQLKRKPDFIILDYHLNSTINNALNGLEILKKIKQISPDTKIIMLSSEDNIKISMDCIDNDAYDFVKKTKTAFTRINSLITYELEEIEISNSPATLFSYIFLILIMSMLMYLILNI